MSGHPHNPDGRPYGSDALAFLLKRARYHAEQADEARDEYNDMSRAIAEGIAMQYPAATEYERMLMVKQAKEKDIELENAGKRQEFHSRECARLDARFQAELVYRRLREQQDTEIAGLLRST